MLDLGAQPDVAQEKFRLRRRRRWSSTARLLDWDAFMALPQTEMVRDIHCVTQWSRYDNRFTGVPVRDLLAIASSSPRRASSR